MNDYVHRPARRENIHLINGSVIRVSLLPVCFDWSKSCLEYFCKGKRIKMPKDHIYKFTLDPVCDSCGFRGPDEF